MTPTDVNSGVYKYIFNHYKYFDTSKVEFGFLTRAAEKLKLSEEYKKYGFNVHSFSATQRDNPEKLRNEIKDVLSKYDIIHLHTSSWRGFLIEEIAMELGMEKVIVHSHSTGIDVTNEEDRIAQNKEHIEYRNKFSEQYATDFLACCYKAADWLFGSSIPKEKIQIMPNAIDVNKFAYNYETRNRIRKILGIENAFVIGHVGRYSYTKNQSFLIELVAKIHHDIPNIKLICIGEGENKALLQKAILEYQVEDNVILIDWVNNVNDYLQAFDMFCLPSIFEGLPISVIEAQAAGLPCLVSDSVTEEVEVTPLVKRLPLIIDNWVANINQVSNNQINDRVYCRNLLIDKGYDIESSAGRLMKLWVGN